MSETKKPTLVLRSKHADVESFIKAATADAEVAAEAVEAKEKVKEKLEVKPGAGQKKRGRKPLDEGGKTIRVALNVPKRIYLGIKESQLKRLKNNGESVSVQAIILEQLQKLIERENG